MHYKNIFKKKFVSLILIFLLFFSLSIAGSTFGSEKTQDSATTTDKKSAESSSENTNENTTRVTNKGQIPQSDTTITIREAFPGEGNTINVSQETGSIGILSQYVSQIFRFVAALSVIIAVLVFMAAGYLMIFSQGDSSAKETAKDMIQKVLLGIALLFMSGLLLNFVNPQFYLFGGGGNAKDSVSVTQAEQEAINAQKAEQKAAEEAKKTDTKPAEANPAEAK